MANKREILRNLYEDYIKSTPAKAIIADKTVFFCRLTKTVEREIGVKESEVYAKTRVFKHIYDKRPAEEFDFIIDYLHKIVKYPDDIYKNKNPKRGDFCFVKKIKDDKYLCSLELNNEVNSKEIFIATAFRMRKNSYINNYDLLWSWRDDKPSS